MISKIFVGLLLVTPLICSTQTKELFKSRLIKTQRLIIEYMDFGGEGLPLIVVQGAHNYFDKSSSNSYIKYENQVWINYYSTCTSKHHVMAPLKRGFGKTDTQLDVDNVKSATEDLLSFKWVCRNPESQTRLLFKVLILFSKSEYEIE